MPPLLVSGVEDVKEEKVDLYVTSDRRKDCRGTLQWTVTDLSGAKLGEGGNDVDIAAGKSRIGPLARSSRPRAEVTARTTFSCG